MTGTDPTAPITIMLWGATDSGKTTFLSTLPLATRALPRRDGGRGSCGILPQDDVSADFLLQVDRRVLGDRALPLPTDTAIEVHWRIDGARADGPVDLRVTDRAGGAFLGEDPDRTASLIEEMAHANGLVYLLDPTRERDLRDAWDFFNTVTVRGGLALGSATPDGRLPHHLAVCVTKLDDPEVFDHVRRGRWVTQDDAPPHLPRVSDGDAENYVRWLCAELGDQATTLLQMIDSAFAPERTRYYATSAAGFHLRDGVTDLDDFPNVIHTDDEGPVLRSTPRPVNVVEPLLHMVADVTGRAG